MTRAACVVGCCLALWPLRAPAQAQAPPALELKSWAQLKTGYSIPFEHGGTGEVILTFLIAHPTSAEPSRAFWVARKHVTSRPHGGGAEEVLVRWIDGRQCPGLSAALARLPALEAPTPGKVIFPEPDIPSIELETTGELPFGGNATGFRLTGYGPTSLGRWYAALDATTASCWRPNPPPP